MKKIHIDTDISGDIDDLCALAMTLRWPGEVEITGVTTVGEIGGRRAGYARYVLGLEGRGDIPVAAGADVGLGVYREALGLPPEERYWPEPVPPSPGPHQEAVDLLRSSIGLGAAIVAIGPYSNLSLLELQFPGILEDAELYLMGGYIHPPRSGFPQWGNEMDFNIQVDVESAGRVMRSSHPTLIPLSVTVETALRRAHLDELRRAGALGRLIARQAEAFAADEGNEVRYGQTCAGLPRDIINFQHDPLACAIALGWEEGVEFEDLPLTVEERDRWLTERIDPAGKPVRVVTKVDGARFSEFWIETVKKA